MSKISIRDYNEEFDDLPSFERARKPVVISASKIRPRKLDRLPSGLLGLRRAVSISDQKRIAYVVDSCLEAQSWPDEGEYAEVESPGVTIVTSGFQRESRNRNRPINNRPFSVKRFNHAVRNYSEKINTANPVVFAQLGEVAIFGCPEGEKGTRFIGATLVGESFDTIRAEQEGYVREIMPNITENDLFERKEIRTPHISLLKTDRQELAESFKTALAKTELSGMWVCLTASNTRSVAVA